MLLAMFCWVTLGPADHVHPFVETDDCDLFQEDNMLCHKLCSRMVWRAQQRVWSVHLASKFLSSQPSWASLGCDWQTSSIHGGPTPNLPQHTFRGVVECMPLRVRAILTAKEGPPQSWAGDHNVMPHLCMWYIICCLLESEEGADSLGNLVAVTFFHRPSASLVLKKITSVKNSLMWGGL